MPSCVKYLQEAGWAEEVKQLRYSYFQIQKPKVL